MEKHLSNNLKWLLSQYNISTSELARRCQLSQPVLHRLVVGDIDNPQLDTLLAICAYFNCSLDTLVFENLAANNDDLPFDQVEIKHIMRNSLTVINSLIQGLEKSLPIFAQSYLSLPKELRIGDISSDMISMIPKMLNHTLDAITTLKASINRL
ncbi:MAG: helix-turn-helix transcriptional regulator [Gammaproteobacteria bacterium]